MMITEKELHLRKARIIHNAFLLFCQKGVDGVTMDAIAAAAQVSTASVYRYFSTKVALMSQTQTALWQEIAEDFATAVAQTELYEQKSGLEQVAVLLRGFYLLYSCHAEYVLFSYNYRLYLVRHGLKIPVEEYGDAISSVRKLFVAALQRGKGDGSIMAQEGTEDLYYATWGLMRGFVGKIVIYNSMYQGQNPWEGRYILVCNMVLSALQHGAASVAFPETE